MNETAVSAARAAPPTVPAEVAVPPGDGSVQLHPGGDGGVSFATNGHQYSILVVPGANGGDVTRIVQDGATLVEIGGTPASLATATNADITLFFEGQSVFSDVVSLQGNALALIPEQFRPVPGFPGGPLLQKALPCMTEIAAFGAASTFLSLELFLAKNAPGSVSLRELWAAGSAVVIAGIAVFNCLAANWN